MPLPVQHVFSLRLPQDLATKLGTEAKARGITRNALIRLTLRESLARQRYSAITAKGRYTAEVITASPKLDALLVRLWTGEKPVTLQDVGNIEIATKPYRFLRALNQIDGSTMYALELVPAAPEPNVGKR